MGLLQYPCVRAATLVGLTVYRKSTRRQEPSVEHPQEILSAGDNGEINVNVLGKNLADVSRVTNATGADILKKYKMDIFFNFMRNGGQNFVYSMQIKKV